MKRMLFPILLASLLAIAVAADPAADKAAPPKKEAALECKCGCRNCPPNATLSRAKNDLYRYRRCFRDANNNGICDNSIADGQKCQNDCVPVTVEEVKKQGKTVLLSCEGCPCPANCAKCVK